jgi:hypothetical protein
MYPLEGKPRVDLIGASLMSRCLSSQSPEIVIRNIYFLHFISRMKHLENIYIGSRE